MIRCLMKLILVGTLSEMFWRKNLVVNGHVCDIGMRTGFLTANCSARQILDVPQDLDSNIEFLFLTHNTFVRLDENSFARYQNLVLLSLQNTVYLDQLDPINYNTFAPLKKLELILFNEISTPFNFSFYLPPSLRLIAVNHNTYIRDMDLSDLKKLEDLHALTYSLRNFPKFHALSPLSFLDFRGNPMDTLTAEDLAPFCTLDFLSLEWPKNAIINGSDRYCQCVRLENWLIKFHIGTNGPLNCTAPANPDADPCNLEYSEDTLLKRRECLGRLARPTVSAWFWIVSCILLFGPLIVVTFKETKTHQRLNLRSTTSTRNPGRFPKVELIIDVDEDFDDEYESEELFDEPRKAKKEDKKRTSLNVKQQDDFEEDDLEEEEIHRNEEMKNHSIQNKASEKTDDRKTDQLQGSDSGNTSDIKLEGHEKQNEQRKFDIEDYLKKGDRKASLRVKPHEDFEDVFDVEMPKMELEDMDDEFESDEKFVENKKEAFLRVKPHEDFEDEFEVEMPNRQLIAESQKKDVCFYTKQIQSDDYEKVKKEQNRSFLHTRQNDARM